jgi:hypothetical protein
MKSISSLTAAQLRRAAAIKEQIDTLESELGKILGGVAEAGSGSGHRGMSASGRARIAAAQKARWAKMKGNGGGGSRRRMSAAARAKIAAAAKARWAKAKAAGRKSL